MPKTNIEDHETLKWINCYCWFYKHISRPKQAQFITLLNTFINETRFEGVGLEVTYEMKVAIGGWAVFLVLNSPINIAWYNRVALISIYAGSTVNKKAIGQMLDGSHYCQIELAWDDVRDSSTKASINRNTILHEFAHALDHIDRYVDGVPTPLLTADERQQWKTIFTPQYVHSRPWYSRKRLWNFFALEAWNEYDSNDSSCVNVAELFAVSTEFFFECPSKLLRYCPEIYQCLKKLYGIDPVICLPKK